MAKKKANWWWLTTGQTSNTCRNKVGALKDICQPTAWCNKQFNETNDEACKKENCLLKCKEKING
jgi:hypothetical protein